MNPSNELLTILACPACRGDVVSAREGRELVCRNCGRAYPVRRGIPIMLVDEARLPSAPPRPA